MSGTDKTANKIQATFRSNKDNDYDHINNQNYNDDHDNNDDTDNDNDNKENENDDVNDNDNVRTKIFGILKFTLLWFLSAFYDRSYTDQPHVGSCRVVSAPCRHYVETCRNMACYGDVDVET